MAGVAQGAQGAGADGALQPHVAQGPLAGGVSQPQVRGAGVGQGAGAGGVSQPHTRFLTPIVTLMNLRACVDGQQLGFGRHIHAHFPWHSDLGH